MGHLLLFQWGLEPGRAGTAAWVTGECSTSLGEPKGPASGVVGKTGSGKPSLMLTLQGE